MKKQIKPIFGFNTWALLFALTGTVLSPVAVAQHVERSGNVYHAEVCPGPAQPETARCHAHVVTDSRGVPFQNIDRHGNPFSPPANPDRGGGATVNSTPAGYSPGDLRSAYGLTDADRGYPYTTIAIVDAYGYTNALKDLNIYRNQFLMSSLPLCANADSTGCFAKYNQKGQQSSYPRDNTGWAQETALDLQMASAMCPACKIILVEASSNSYTNLAAAENMAFNLGAKIISNSYGGGESGINDSAYNHDGIAITVSSGDSGYGVQYPASSSHVIAVGGTSLYLSSGRYETVWSGAGSGCSNYYSKPTWQLDTTGCAKRTVADVSAVADPSTGVAVYAPTSSRSSAWMVFGGTSVAAPLIAGIYAINGSSTYFGADSLYAVGASLNDVTSGSNGNCGNYLCTGVTGYDGPSGVGTPKGATAFK
jgi:subtilase family serine protease